MHRHTLPARPLARALLATLPLLLATLPLLLAACGSDSGSGNPSTGCTIAYTGGATENVWCDAPVVRTNGSGGYVLWVMAFRGAHGLGADQAGQVTVTISPRPVIGVDYGFGAGIASGFETRTAGGTDTHEAVAGSSGAFSVRFTTLPAIDGSDPSGFDGIGTVHGAFSATLVAISGGSDVTVAGTF